jgi:hypothetical protein
VPFAHSLRELDAALDARLVLRFNEVYASTTNSHTGERRQAPSSPEIRVGGTVVHVDLGGDSTSFEWGGDLGQIDDRRR